MKKLSLAILASGLLFMASCDKYTAMTDDAITAKAQHMVDSMKVQITTEAMAACATDQQAKIDAKLHELQHNDSVTTGIIK